MLNKFLLSLCIALLLWLPLSAQVAHGTVQEGLLIKSKILGKEVRYSVYLPFDYETSNRYYPVVYLLHGYTDNDIGWIQYGEANLSADEAIADRRIPPMILIMPDAGVSWYINNYDSSVRYEDFFIREFMPYIESHYRILAKKRFRGVAGLSMGGFGSLVYALKHPDLFSACAAFSAAIHSEKGYEAMPDNAWDLMFGPVFGPDLKGKERLTPHLQANDPFYIVQKGDSAALRSVRYYLDCGDDDHLSRGNSAFHILLSDLNIPHEYRVRDGRHSWPYWRSGLVDGLAFIGAGFHLQ
ncbi:MAG: alpha/beta hydrolase-fold protein [Calditrichia bacterium]